MLELDRTNNRQIAAHRVTKTIVDDIKLCTKYVVVELLCWCLYRQEHIVTLYAYMLMNLA
jgi:hypothetical protein